MLYKINSEISIIYEAYADKTDYVLLAIIDQYDDKHAIICQSIHQNDYLLHLICQYVQEEELILPEEKDDFKRLEDIYSGYFIQQMEESKNSCLIQHISNQPQNLRNIKKLFFFFKP